MINFLDEIYWGNTLKSYLIAAASFLLAILLIAFFKYVILRKLRRLAHRTSTSWDDFLIDSVKGSVVPVLYISAFYFTVSALRLPEKVDKVLHVAYLVAVTFFVLKVITAAFRKFVYSFINRQENGYAKQKQANGLIIIVSVVIWLLGFIFLIDNLGYNVTTLIAGLGIGGIAIALAAQTILGDLFSYFVIFFDKPFEIGDFVVVDDKNGVIEAIGIKTTRIQTLNGEQLICSNTDLTNARLHNFKRMESRRILFKLGVTYQTSYTLLKEIPEIVKNIIVATAGVRFDRGHFSAYGDFSLNFEFVYYVDSADYNVYMDKQQQIYFEIFKAFEEKGIDFAYPTQTLFLQKEEEKAS